LAYIFTKYIKHSYELEKKERSKLYAAVCMELIRMFDETLIEEFTMEETYRIIIDIVNNIPEGDFDPSMPAPPLPPSLSLDNVEDESESDDEYGEDE
jgi:hypothetical protein